MINRVIFDNDALLKLARYGLLDRTISMLGDSLAIEILATARYVLRPANDPLKRCVSVAAADRLDRILHDASKVVSVDNLDLVDLLNAVPGIDAGEAMLLARAASDLQSVLITGDKRSLKALWHEDLPTVQHMLQGRIYTLEMVMAVLVKLDFKHTQIAVRSDPDADKSLAIAFGVSAAATQESVEEGLRSYINDVQLFAGQAMANMHHLTNTA